MQTTDANSKQLSLSRYFLNSQDEKKKMFGNNFLKIF